MRKIAFFLVAACMMSLLFSCGNKQKNVVVPDQKPVYTFSKEDTAEIMSLVNEFTELLTKKNLRDAVGMLQFLAEGDSIQPLDPVAERRQAMTLVNAEGVRYTFNHLTLRSNTNNEVKIDITLFDKLPGDPKPNMTALYLRPVKFEGKWYLTVWDNITNTNQDLNQD